MHEISLAEEVINIVNREGDKKISGAIEEISIEVGNLSGVDAEAFKSALELLVNGTILAGASINIISKKGLGTCYTCNLEFEMDHRMDTCPECQCFPSKVSGGEELRIVSLMIA